MRLLVFCCLLLLLGQCWQHAIHLVDGSVQAKPFLPIARSTQQEYGVMITLCKQVSPELVQQLQQTYNMTLHHFIPENSFYVVTKNCNFFLRYRFYQVPLLQNYNKMMRFVPFKPCQKQQKNLLRAEVPLQHHKFMPYWIACAWKSVMNWQNK